jgi:hypothetical protein
MPEQLQTSLCTTTTSLLYRARIQVFAEKYLIDDLRVLCLCKLPADLRDFDLTLQTKVDLFWRGSNLRTPSDPNSSAVWLAGRTLLYFEYIIPKQSPPDSPHFPAKPRHT